MATPTEVFGVPLVFKEVIGAAGVMDTLFAVEQAYPRAGQAMLETKVALSNWYTSLA